MKVFSDRAELGKGLATDLFTLAERCVEESGSFLVGYPGGSVVSIMSPWIVPSRCSKWHWALVDERCAPLDHPDSNYRLICTQMPHGNPIAPEFHSDPSTMCAQLESALAGRMRELGKDCFDAIVLGVGPDGHVASLFPGREWEDESNRMLIVVRDSPKPPPTRVSMTIGVLKGARQVLVVVSGMEKLDALAMAAKKDPRTPLSHLSYTLYTEKQLAL